MKKEKRLLAFLLSLVLCIGMLPTSAFAADFSSGAGSDQAIFSDGSNSVNQPAQTAAPAEIETPAEETVITEEETPEMEDITVDVEESGEEEPVSDVETPEAEEPVSGDASNENGGNAEEFISEEEISVTEEEVPSTEEPVMVARNSVMLLDASDSENVTVSVEGAGEITEKEIILGEFDEENTSLTIEGYDFVRAQIGFGSDYTTITGLYKIADSDDYYATIEGNTTTGMRISNTKDVALVYETHRETYTVTYQVKIGSQTYSENFDSMVAVAGASSVKSGSSLEFAAVIQDGYSLVGNPESTSGQVSAGANNTYTVRGISGDTTITLTLQEITKYDMSFAGSNTRLTYNGRNYESDHNSSGQIEYDWTYDASDKVVFTLKGRGEYNSNTKILNQLSITIDGVAAAAEIPDSVGAVNKVVTTIAKGYTVTVTKMTAGRYPEYSVEITNPSGGKVRGAIHIQTNFKDYNSSEVWAKQLDGVEPLAYKKGNGTIIWRDNEGDQNSRLQPEVYTYYSRDTKNNSTYYVKLTGTYDARDLYLTVLSYGVPKEGQDAKLEYTIIDNKRVSELEEATINSRYGDYDYQFAIPKDDRNNSYQDIRIYIQYKPQTDAEYKIIYDADDGEFTGSDSNTYKVGSSAVLSEVIPTKEGYVFDGWYLEDASEKVYDSGTLFTITEENRSYAKPIADKLYGFTFKAKWTEASKATYAPFQVQIFFQTLNGGELSYSNVADFTTHERGRIGSYAYIIPSALQEYLDTAKPDWEEEYEYDTQETDIPIAAGSTTVLKIKYKLKVFRVYHTGAEGGNVDIIKMSSLNDGTYDLTQNLTKDTLYGGYYLDYTNKTSGAAYNGSNATWSAPQTENGKAMHPRSGVTYYVKEVPVTYMVPAQINTYNHVKDYLRDIILLTTIDDAMYKQVGFLIGTSDYQVGGTPVTELKIHYGSNSDFEDPDGEDGSHTESYGVQDVSSNDGGYIVDYGYFSVSSANGQLDYSAITGKNIIVKAYWVTPDGLTVTGKITRRISVKDIDKDSIIDYDKNSSYGEVTVMDLITGIKVSMIDALNNKVNGAFGD